jgi:L-alanine-DL-glutamate epimerase-like enolase superfamily enzyme
VATAIREQSKESFVDDIIAVTATAVAVPLETVTSMSSRTVHERQYVLVEVRTSDLRGIGYTYAGTTGGTIVRDVVDLVLAPILRGRRPDDTTRLWSEMYQEALLIGRRGAVVRAISAVDIALYDLLASAAGRSLAEYLGGGGDRTLPAYASGGYYRADEDPLAAIEKEIARNLDLGFADHKIKVGGRSVAEDARRVALARELVGPTGRLALDANNAYRGAAEALGALRAFERAAGDGGLWWFEEPLSPEDVAGHAELVRRADTPIATGEIHQTRWDFRSLHEARAMHINQADAAVVGGVGEWMRIAALSAGNGVLMAPHWHANLHVHLAAAVPNLLAVEHFDLEKDIFNFERLLTEPTRLRPVEGRVPVPTGPGLGIEFDPAAVRSFTVGG